MTQIDIAALVADLTGPIPVIEGLSGPYPDETAIRDTADQAVAALIAQDAELKRLRAVDAAIHVTEDQLRRWVSALSDWDEGAEEAIAEIEDLLSARAALGEKP